MVGYVTTHTGREAIHYIFFFLLTMLFNCFQGQDVRMGTDFTVSVAISRTQYISTYSKKQVYTPKDQRGLTFVITGH